MSPFHKRRPVRRPIVRSRSSGYSFVSYSSKDWPVVSKLVSALKGHRVWVDKRIVELGDALPEKVESGIGGASSFILVLSKASLDSRWVKYESHMAVIRHLEDANFRILVLKIDDCHVPLRFRPFLYADLSKDAAALDLIVRAASSKDPPTALYRRLFVNRNDDLGRIDLHVADPDKSLVCLQGFYGIGKRALAEESIRRTWQSPRIVAIELSSAHRGARLSAALCAAAGIPVPFDGTPDQEIRKASLLAVERLIEQKSVIILDHLEYLLDDEGKPHSDIAAVIDHVSAIPASFDIPCYLLSRRLPKLQASSALRTGYVRVSGMHLQHIVTILESEAARISRKPVKANAAFRKLAEHLFGYPLAGRLAAPLLVKYSPEYLLENLVHITSLRRDIAEAILANTDFSGEETRILQLLAISDGALSVDDLASMSETSPDSVVDSIDVLADHNLLESDRASVRLHPLVADFYWKQARSAPDFRTIVSRIADHALRVLKLEKPDTVRFVSWLATACRTLFLSDRAAEALALRRDFSGELKLAAIELYQRGDYDISLRYCEAYLEHDATDFEVSLHRARNLSRLAKPEESLKAIETMTRIATTPHQKARLHFARGRIFWETRKIDLARSEYVKALDLNPKFLPALQGVADSLMAENKTDDASGFVERALKVSPMDSHSLSAKAEIFWRRGKWREAVDTMEVVVRAQPENPTFLFRLGRFLQQSGLLEQARDYFHRAKAADQTFIEPRLSLASIAVDLGGLAEAKAEIDSLRGKLPADKRFVLDEIEAKYNLALGNLEAAAALADKALTYHRNAFTLSLMAKVEAAMYKEAQQNGMSVTAESHRTRALTLIDEGLTHEPASSVLLNQNKSLGGPAA